MGGGNQDPLAGGQDQSPLGQAQTPGNALNLPDFTYTMPPQQGQNNIFGQNVSMFDVLQDDLYQRMKARAQQDFYQGGQIGYADPNEGFSF